MDKKSERWAYASAGRNHGKVERQVREMVSRIVDHNLSHVVIEVVSEETYRLREIIKAYESIVPDIRERLKTFSSNSHLNSHSESVFLKFEKTMDEIKRMKEEL